jgi:putative GTP pyrophosphokinase
MEAQTQRTPEEWGRRYQEERRLHAGFAKALDGLLPQLLDQASIPFSQIEYRTKEVPDFVEKLKRKDEKYKDPLTEVTDLVGLRIVLFYLDDVERVGEVIEREFAVDPEHSGDKRALLDPDRFGYLSVHHIVRLSPSRAQLPEWVAYREVCAEIQVRTVLQHAWAAISRKLAYANVRDAPRKLQRNLNRLSALFELADDQFMAIRKSREEIEAEHALQVERGKLEAELMLYLEGSDAVKERVEGLARDAGFPADGSKNDQTDAAKQQFRKSLMLSIERGGVERVSDFENKLEELWDAIPELMEAVNEHYFDPDRHSISTEPYNWLSLILLWSLRVSEEVFEGLGYDRSLASVVRATYDGTPS